MYLSQVFSAKNKWLYTVICLIKIFSMFLGTPSDDSIDNHTEEQQSLAFFAFALSTFAFLLLILFFIVKIIHEQNIIQFTTGRKKIDYKRILFSFLTYGGIHTLLIFSDYILHPNDYVWNFQLTPFLWLVLISLLLLPFQIGFEEYFFRGYMMQWLALLSKNRWLPFLGSSIIFGLVHISNPEVEEIGYKIMSSYIGFGFMFGILALMDDGLELPIGCHFAHNLTIFLLTTSKWSVIQTPAILQIISPPDYDFTSFLLYDLLPSFIVIFIFAKKYKWKNWKEKLFGKIIPNA